MRSTSRAVLAGSVLALLLAACGGSKNEKPGINYSTPGADGDSKKTSLLVPPDLIAPARDDRYVVPAAGQVTSALALGAVTPSVPAGTVQAGAASGKIRIERAGNERWLVVQGVSAATLWPKLQNYWKDLGFVLVSDNPQAGLMETEWAENHANIKGDAIQDILSKALGTRYSTGERDKFRLRLETSAQPGSVEIYISHRGMIEERNSGGLDGSYWTRRPNDPALEAEMLQRLMVRLGTDEKLAEKAVVEAKAPVAARAKLGNAADGSLQLTVSEPIDRAWRQLGLALDRTGVVVEDRDRAKSAYFVRYIAIEDASTQKEREGWFARMFSWGSKKESGTNQFRVEAVADGQQTVVRLLNKDGAAAPAASAKQILNLLYNEMK